jgi:hypothetical protein
MCNAILQKFENADRGIIGKSINRSIAVPKMRSISLVEQLPRRSQSTLGGKPRKTLTSLKSGRKVMIEE